MLRFVICDANEQHNQYVLALLNSLISELQVDGHVALVTTDAADVFEFSRLPVPRHSRSVYLLDTNLQRDMDGIELARHVRQVDRQADLIFITAHPEHVMRSVKLKLTDFLLKPVRRESLVEVIQAVNKDLLQSKMMAKYIEVKSEAGVDLLDVSDIVYIESSRNKVIIHLTDLVTEVYESMANMELLLKGEGFYRCHRAFIINLSHIRDLDLPANRVIMSNGDACLISVRQRKGLIAHAKRLL